MVVIYVDVNVVFLEMDKNVKVSASDNNLLPKHIINIINPIPDGLFEGSSIIRGWGSVIRPTLCSFYT